MTYYVLDASSREMIFVAGDLERAATSGRGEERQTRQRNIFCRRRGRSTWFDPRGSNFRLLVTRRNEAKPGDILLRE